MNILTVPTTSPLRGTPPRAGSETLHPSSHAASILLLPEEEYPEGGRWWE